MAEKVDRQDYIGDYRDDDRRTRVKFIKKWNLLNQIGPPAKSQAPLAGKFVASRHDKWQCHCRPSEEDKGKAFPGVAVGTKLLIYLPPFGEGHGNSSQ